MSDIIRLLPDSVANQIAAGEVIQRPASVIKELVENAVDAGARHIDVLVEEAGRTSVQVIDDGKGMSETDARLAFERHATSKIQKADDLFSLRTMGFRGEALPSIVAVAQVTLRTRTPDQELGTCLQIEGSRVLSQEVVACPVGSNFLVQNLFFNVPVRRKFLKSNQTELNNIVQEFERMALVNPSVSFTFSNNGTLVSSLPATTLLQRIVAVFGKRLSTQLLDVKVDTMLCRLKGFVGKPESSRKKGVHQFFFVNGRYMRHPYFHRAVQEAFSGLVPETEQVPYFLYFEVDPANIDVNIHPTKTEIKFENEQAIWQIIVAGIKESLGKYNAVPMIEFDTEGLPADIPVYNPAASSQVTLKAPDVEANPDYNPFATSSTSSGTETRRTRMPDFLTMPGEEEGEEMPPEDSVPAVELHVPAPAMGEEVPVPAPAPEEELALDNDDTGERMLYADATLRDMEKSTEHYQFRGQYVLTSIQSGLLIVDQHRAHVRILYNRYREQMGHQVAPSQGLLFPELIQLPSSDALVLSEMEDDLRHLGFDLTSLGQGSYSLLGVPAGIDGLDPVKLVTDMVTSVREMGKPAREDMQHRVALTMARGAAIPAGQALSGREMSALLDDLFATDNPNFAPDGKKILAVLPLENIDKLFRS